MWMRYFRMYMYVIKYLKLDELSLSLSVSLGLSLMPSLIAMACNQCCSIIFSINLNELNAIIEFQINYTHSFFAQPLMLCIVCNFRDK